MSSIKLVITGVGKMGGPGIIAAQQIAEPLRRIGINFELAGLVDLDDDNRPQLERAVRFVSAGLYPPPQLRFLQPSCPDRLDKLLAEDLKLATTGNNLVIYDATPTKFHALNMVFALELPRATYLGEKPLVTTREQLSSLAQYTSAPGRVYCNFIETQSSVCLKLLDLIAHGELEIQAMRFWRLNSSGTSKAYRPGARLGVEGGALMDKSVHDIAVSVALLARGKVRTLQGKPQAATALCFLPGLQGNEKRLLTGYNNLTNFVSTGEGDTSEWTADGAAHYDVEWQASAAPHIRAEYYCSWIGVTEFDRLCHATHKHSLLDLMRGYRIPREWLFRQRESDEFVEEDARLLELQGRLNGKETTLVVNFLSRKGITPWIYDVGLRREISHQPMPYQNNSLARVLEQVVLSATGKGQQNYLGYEACNLCHTILLAARRKLFANFPDFDEAWRIGLTATKKPITF